MKVLFAVSNEEISESIVKKYQKEYKEILSYKNVYYFNAILKEIQKDKSYDRIVISEDLEAFSHTQYDQIDKFIFDKLDSISDEASNIKGNDTPIILICSDRRTKSEQMLVKFFGIGIYNAIIGNDRSVDEVCRLIHRPRLKKDAKSYYKIDSEEVNYQAENENDVSEMEIQNIVAYYKSLGKNEDKYVESFDTIAAQYNDVQLRIISKFLPLNVKAVLEERSPKYQKIISFNSSVSNNLRYGRSAKKKEESSGMSEKLLKSKVKSVPMSNPVVIPSAVNMAGTKKLLKKQANIEENENKNSEVLEVEPVEAKSTKIPRQVIPKPEVIEPVEFEQEEPIEEEPIVKPVKRGRGRPRKNPVQINEVEEPTVKRGRGRPRKNIEPVVEEQPAVLPGFDDEYEEPEVEEEVTMLPGFNNNYDYEEEEKEEQPAVLPGFDDYDDEPEEEYVQPVKPVRTQYQPTMYEDDEEEEDEPLVQAPVLPQFEEDDETDENEVESIVNKYKNPEPIQRNIEPSESLDISNLLSADKKIVSFVGTSKNGTSFIVNNVAELLSSMGINTAILDTTKNRNSYYIYTKNEEALRQMAAHSIEGLIRGMANGVQVNKNLTVYVELPNQNNSIEETDKILETLIKNYSVVLIDCDFDTPIGYFRQSQETYLVQSMDILTIQPLTAFLRELKAKNVLDEKKLRVILNKMVKVRGVTEKTIIGGMAFYNDPAMSYMTELFDRNLIKYIAVPFEEEVYTKYLESVINCEVSLKGYTKTFMQVLRELGNMIYPVALGRGGYNTPTRGGTFPTSMNNTLNQMKRNY